SKGCASYWPLTAAGASAAAAESVAAVSPAPESAAAVSAPAPAPALAPPLPDPVGAASGGCEVTLSSGSILSLIVPSSTSPEAERLVSGDLLHAASSAIAAARTKAGRRVNGSLRQGGEEGRGVGPQCLIPGLRRNRHA